MKKQEEKKAIANPGKLKFRKEATVEPAVVKFIEDLIEGKTILKWESIAEKSKDNRNFLYNIINIGANVLAFDDLDKFEKQVVHLFDLDGKKMLWERNHILILNAISKLTKDYGRFPARLEISRETELSRATVNKHLKNYFGSNEQQEKQEEYLIMREKVLSTVFNYAKTGDMKAAKVFLDATTNQQPAARIKNQQNNFVQINDTTITEEQLKQLPEDQQLQLQQILASINDIPNVILNNNKQGLNVGF